MVLLVSIEGNIGSGKSTLVENLKKYYKYDTHICFLDEPVDKWNDFKDYKGKTILENYYENQSKYSFSFQMMAYISRLIPLKNALKKNYKIIITERSIFTDRMVFAKMLYDMDKINEIEFQIYNEWFTEFLEDIPNPVIIYVRTNPNTAKTRVDKRARVGENINIKYLEKCHNYHESWLDNVSSENILMLDGEQDINENPSQIDLWINIIDKSLNIHLNKNNSFINYLYSYLPLKGFSQPEFIQHNS